MSQQPKPEKRSPRPRRPIARTSRPRQASGRPAARVMRLNDAIWRTRVRIRARGLCERCDWPGTDSHHLISRRYRATRHELSNGVYLCRLHHTFSPYSAHAKPREFKAWFMHTFPDRWAALMTVKKEAS